MKSVLYTNPFVKKRIINDVGEDFSSPAVIIANHTSFLDILAIGMLHPKICFLVNDWVYHSPIFGKAVQRADFYPISKGIENSMESLREKISQGYSLMVFPEGSRSHSNKIRRFHKGAFYLAEQFKLDVLPVLIHGNSEVNPKGSFIIKDGSITIEFLPRISYGNTSFGDNYTRKAKKVGVYFREESFRLRQKIETPKYFQPAVLQEYRYKGNSLYHNVKRDLKEFSQSYFEVITRLEKKTKILHISEDFGQLDFLLALDGPDRKITTVLKDEELLAVLRHSYLTQKNHNLHFVDSLQNHEWEKFDVLIVSSEGMVSEIIKDLPKNLQTIVLLKGAIAIETKNILILGYQEIYSDTNIIIFEYSQNTSK